MPRLNTRRFTLLDILGTLRLESPVAWLTLAEECLATREVILAAMPTALVEYLHLANNRRGLNTQCGSMAATERGSK